MEMERDDLAQRMPVPQGQGGAIPSALYVEGMTLAEKAKYGMWVGGAGFLGAEVLGMGATGILIGLAAGGTAAYFSENIRNQIIDRLPSPKSTRSRRMDKVNWFITGREPQGNEYDEDQEDEDALFAQLDRLSDTPMLPDLEEVDRTPVFPPVPPRRMLALGYLAGTQRRFDPPINMLLGRGALLAGAQGAGKSNIIGLIAQAAGLCGMPELIIDYKGEFYTLRDVLPNCILTGHPDYEQDAGPGFYPLTAESAPELATIIMTGPFQVVLDIPSYNGDNDMVAQSIAALLHSLMNYSKDIMRQGMKPWPCLIITDEAHNLLPQKQNLSGLVMENAKESFGALTSAYSRLANAGRSFGYTMVLATQRLPNIAKWSIANLQIKVIGVHAEKNDLNACEEETEGRVDRETIKSLPSGSGVVVGLTPEPVIVRFDKQKARHVSDTPKVERLEEVFANRPVPRLSQALRQIRPAQQVPQTDPLPALSREQVVVPQQQELPSLPPAPQQRQTQGSGRHSEYAKWVEVWNSGHDSVRRFAEATDMTESSAYKLLSKMDKLGLIQMKKRRR